MRTSSSRGSRSTSRSEYNLFDIDPLFLWSSASFLLFILSRIWSGGMRSLHGSRGAGRCSAFVFFVTTFHGSPVSFCCLHRFLYNEVIHAISNLILDKFIVEFGPHSEGTCGNLESVAYRESVLPR